jgi:hypothetical protein
VLLAVEVVLLEDRLGRHAGKEVLGDAVRFVPVVERSS